jgi:hypothetical protein
MTNTYELYPRFDSRKSFYGKARVKETNDGITILQSYDTSVCSIDAAGNFHRHWSGESSTTMRHVNEFIRQHGIPGGGVAWWRQLPVESLTDLYFDAYFSA